MIKTLAHVALAADAFAVFFLGAFVYAAAVHGPNLIALALAFGGALAVEQTARVIASVLRTRPATPTPEVTQ